MIVNQQTYVPTEYSIDDGAIRRDAVLMTADMTAIGTNIQLINIIKSSLSSEENYGGLEMTEQ